MDDKHVDLVKRSDLHGKTVVVTGANTGIGKEAARELARTGARVILACRNLDRANEAREDIVADTKNEDVVVKILDLASLQSVRDFARDINGSEARVDILLNNAGVYMTERTQTKDGFEMVFGVNHLGHFLLTNLLLDKLKASAPSRIVTVSSIAHEKSKLNLNDLQSTEKFSPDSVYGQSKSANILFTVHLAAMLQGSGVTTYCLHPGFVRTEIARDVSFLSNECGWCCMDCLWRCFQCEKIRTPIVGAQTTLYCCLDASLSSVSGRYYSNSKEKPAKRHATDPETADKLWEESMRLVGL